MVRIGLIGANGQVGAEVALFLSSIPEVDLTCFVRSSYSTVLFRRASIRNVVVNLGRGEKTSELSAFDLIADFSYPAGALPDFRQRISTHVSSVILNLSPKCKYAHMSSLMAFGMPAECHSLKNYRIPRTTYAVVKRRTERAVFSESARFGISAYCIRLGEVHGVLQSVSNQLQLQLGNSQIHVAGGRDEPSIVVFASSIAHALINIAKGEVLPGLYSLTSHPQWSLHELYAFYQSSIPTHSDVRYLERGKPSFYSRSKTTFFGVMNRYRSWIEVMALMNSPLLFSKAKGIFRRNTSQSVDCSLLCSAIQQKPIVGRTPGNSIDNIRSDRDSISQAIAVTKRIVHSSTTKIIVA